MGIFRFLVILCVSFAHIEAISLLSPAIFEADKKYIVVPIDVLGLANRLRILASFYTIAKASDRTLVIIWAPSEECNATFDDLFDERQVYNSLGVVVVTSHRHGPLENDFIKSEFIAIHQELSRHVLFRFPSDFYVSTNFSLASGEDVDIVVLRSASTHSPMGVSCEEHTRWKMELYAGLSPSQTVRELQQEAVDKLLLKWKWGKALGVEGDSSSWGPIVGVHIRSHDPRFDWPVVSPQSVSDHYGHALTFDEGTPVEAIVSAMEDILRKHANVRFFLASNSEGVKAAITAHFNPEQGVHSTGAVVLSLSVPPAWGRDTSEGVQFALLEMSLLGGLSDLLLHTKGSSFAVEAAFMPPFYLRPPSQHNKREVSGYWERKGDLPVPVVDSYSVSRDPLERPLYQEKSEQEEEPEREEEVGVGGAGGLGHKEGSENKGSLASMALWVHLVTLHPKCVQCGVQDFLNANPPAGAEVVCYREEAAGSSGSNEQCGGDGVEGGDGRCVCSHRVLADVCLWVHEVWGLANVFCVQREEEITESTLSGRSVVDTQPLYVLLDISGYSAAA